MTNFIRNDAAHAMRRVFVSGLCVHTYIGIHPHERTAPQPLLIDLSVNVHETAKPPQNIHDIVCYEHLVNEIRHILARGHVDLIEILAEDICAHILRDKRIAYIKLRLAKPEAIRDAQNAGIEIERYQAE